MYLTPILVHEAKQIVYTPAILYNYEKRAGSITADLSAKNAQDQYDAKTQSAQHLTEWGYPSLSEKYLQINLLSFVSRGWESPELNNECIQYLRGLKRCPSHFSFKQRIKFHLIVISPTLYRQVYRIFMCSVHDPYVVR